MTADPWDVFSRHKKPTPPTRTATVYTSGNVDSRYALTALEQEAQRVIDAPEGTRNHALNRAAFSLAQLVAGGALPEAEVIDTLTHGALQAGLDRVEIARTIASGMEAGRGQPRGVPEQPDAESWVNSLPAAGTGEVITVDPETGEVMEKAPEQLAAEWHAKQVERALVDLRIKDEAARAFKAEVAARDFREPPSTWTLADELLIPDEPVTYAVDGLLPTGSNALLAAQFKTGKTTFINNLARSFADGVPFLGRYDVNPAGGRIALYNYELDPSMNRRWLRDMNIANPDRVVVLNLRGFRLPITAPAVEDWVVRWLAEREVTMWVVDPFARAAVGTDENSNTEVGVWLDTLDIIKSRAGVRDLVLPTHTGRAEQEAGQERARGATRLDDWADVRWLLTKNEDDDRFFRATGRDVDVPEELVSFTEADRSLRIGGGDRKWVQGRRLSQAVLDFINASPGCGVSAIQNGVTGNKGQIDDARIDLIHRHKVRTEDGPRGAVLHFGNEATA